MSKNSSRNERSHNGLELRLSEVAKVEEQGYTNAQAARELGIHENRRRSDRNRGQEAPELRPT